MTDGPAAPADVELIDCAGPSLVVLAAGAAETLVGWLPTSTIAWAGLDVAAGLFGSLHPTVAGAYYALLVGLAATAIWRYRSGLPATSRRLALTVLLVLLAGAWGFRAAGTIVRARDEAWAVRDEWTDRYERESPSPRRTPRAPVHAQSDASAPPQCPAPNAH